MNIKNVNTQAQANQDAAARLMAAAVAHNVRDVVMAPGSRSTPLVLAAHAHPRLGVHVIVDERVAGFVALGLARAHGRPVMVVVTSGSAGAHVLPAVVEACHSLDRLIVVTADRPLALHNMGAEQTTTQTHFFTAHVREQVSLPVPVPGASLTDVDATVLSWGTQSALALHRAQCGPPGVVHFNAPFNEPLWSEALAPADWSSLDVPSFIARPAHDDITPMLACVVPVVSRAASGAIVVGPMPCATHDACTDAESGWHDAVVGLSEHLGWPIIADGLSQLRFGRHARDLIWVTNAVTPDDSVDVVLQVGRTPVSKAVQSFVAAAKKTVAFTPYGHLYGPMHTARIVCACDADIMCRRLVQSVAKRLPVAKTLALKARDLAAQTIVTRVIEAPGMWEASAVAAVFDCIDEPACVVVGNSLTVRDVDAFVPPKSRPLALYGSRGVNGIDGTIAQAMGLMLGGRWRLTVAVMGDLSFVHDMAALQALAQCALANKQRLLIVVINNHGGHIFDGLPIADNPDVFTPLFVAPQKVDVVALAEAMGARAQRVASLVALKDAVRRALADPHGAGSLRDGTALSGAGASCKNAVWVVDVTIDQASAKATRKAAMAELRSL